MSIIADGRAEVRFAESQAVPLGGHYRVYRDDCDGVVDYTTGLGEAIPAWPEGAGKIGDGLGSDGYGADGVGDGGLGDGHGADGLGADGFGARLLAITTPLLDEGDWTFGVVGFDAAGNPAPAATATEIAATIGNDPEPPTALAADAYDADTDTLTFSWTRSADDEGS